MTIPLQELSCTQPVGDPFLLELIENPIKMSPSNESLSPAVYNKQRICSNCDPLIITTDVNKQPEGMLKWWKGAGLDNIGEPNSTTERKSYQEFRMFYNKLVNLSEVCVIPKSNKNWDEIHGQALQDMKEDLTKRLQPSSQRH
jgi:hypothetical protein